MSNSQSDKAKFNVKAKEFKFNVKAKEFKFNASATSFTPQQSASLYTVPNPAYGYYPGPMNNNFKPGNNPGFAPQYFPPQQMFNGMYPNYGLSPKVNNPNTSYQQTINNNHIKTNNNNTPNKLFNLKNVKSNDEIISITQTTSKTTNVEQTSINEVKKKDNYYYTVDELLTYQELNKGKPENIDFSTSKFPEIEAGSIAASQYLRNQHRERMNKKKYKKHSPKKGKRKYRNQTEVKALEVTSNGYKILNQDELDENTIILRDLMAVLNKLTPENFDKIIENLVKFAEKITSIQLLEDIVNAVFNRALFEPNFCPTYAAFCKK